MYVCMYVCMVVFSVDYLLQSKVDCCVELSACTLVVYWSAFQNVQSCPREVLEIP